jgi:hypothetical protein
MLSLKLSLIELKTCERELTSTPIVVMAVSTFLALLTNVNIYPDTVAQSLKSVADAPTIDIGSMVSYVERPLGWRQVLHIMHPTDDHSHTVGAANA